MVSFLAELGPQNLYVGSMTPLPKLRKGILVGYEVTVDINDYEHMSVLCPNPR